MDAKSVAMSIMKKGDKKNDLTLYEFTLSRIASSRGGEHSFVRYDRGTYDPYFQAPNLDWYIVKKTDFRCMLLFLPAPILSVSIICLCHVFLHGGIRRNDISDAITNFMFLHLHNMKKESVATRFTKIFEIILKVRRLPQAVLLDQIEK